MLDDRCRSWLPGKLKPRRDPIPETSRKATTLSLQRTGRTSSCFVPVLKQHLPARGRTHQALVSVHTTQVCWRSHCWQQSKRSRGCQDRICTEKSRGRQSGTLPGMFAFFCSRREVRRPLRIGHSLHHTAHQPSELNVPTEADLSLPLCLLAAAHCRVNKFLHPCSFRGGKQLSHQYY